MHYADSLRYISVDIFFSPIKIVPGDVTGVIYDGPEQTDTSLVDIDAQLDGTLVTAQFEGFESAAHGIARYEWGVGTKPRTDDVMTYTSFGIVLVENNTNTGEGKYDTNS